MLSGMATPAVVSLPGELSYHFGIAKIAGIVWGQGMSFADFTAFWIYCCSAYLLIWFAPNTAQIFGLGASDLPENSACRKFTPVARAAMLTSLLWIAGFGVFTAVPSEFLYFKF
ncbi:MAG: hypothetical protein EOO23_07215 [Comamonadaceae bacterium]|nr:MAG: hypothetical protein EOO23_07215 [Comamonadaceae bacterium]